MQVPIPKIPTIIVAALSIPENLTADDLFVHLWQILDGFLQHKIKIASYASDGSNVERKLQRLLESHATRTRMVSIKHGSGFRDDIKITIPFFGPQPIATLQDPKHLLKTFRNNLFSGARLLTFPNSVALFSQVHDMSQADDSPIYRRDVEKLDRQDDNAATRLFSGDTLKWLTSHRPQHLGLIVYLFVMGELIDAYENRSLPLLMRAQMVLRAHYFIELWERFLDISKYPSAKHYVSPQCADITRTLIHGFFQVLYIYRDHCATRQPLFPWLLSTEVVEHVFGMCRQIVKDFTMLDFQFMVPKLFIRMRETLFSAHISDGKARASGYNHTYSDNRGLDIAALASYPTDLEITEASARAYGEAESLFALLGVSAGDIEAEYSTFPSVRSWFYETGDEDDAENEDQPEEKQYDFQEVLEGLEDSDLSLMGEKVLRDFRYANIALSVDEQMTMCVLF
jgi:hypothetical protein